MLRFTCSRISLVETIPAHLPYPPGSTPHPSTFDTWLQLLNRSRSSVDIASMYWTLRAQDLNGSWPSAWMVRLRWRRRDTRQYMLQGEEVFRALNETGARRAVRIRIVQSDARQEDTELLRQSGQCA